LERRSGQISHTPSAPVIIRQGVTPRGSRTAQLEAQLFGVQLNQARLALEFVTHERRPVREPLDLAACKSAILGGLDPVKRHKLRFLEQFPEFEAAVRKKRSLPDRVMDYPVFDLPMYLPLVESSSERFLPNSHLLERNSVTLLETNTRFLEAYLVGLNHEMSREFLWRGFPTDQRGSYFRRFWDSAEDGVEHVQELHAWRKPLGQNGDAPSGMAVLAIRGDLLAKFPNTAIYAQKASGDGTVAKPFRLDPSGPQLAPVFEASLADIHFLGFPLTPAKLRGTGPGTSASPDPGWFIVLQERPGEPRFGLDVTGRAAPQRWSDLSWERVGVGQDAIVTFDRQVPMSGSGDDAQAAWPPVDSAQLAHILCQQPVLVAVHASKLIPEDP
jgi:hypothetical protein